MKLELHILQNFAPSNLNRDDTGAPKDCEFGGYRRGRISSQCLKRAIRDAFKVHDLLEAKERATRTARLVEAVAEKLENEGRPSNEAVAVATLLLNVAKLKVASDGSKTEYLLFIPARLITRLASLAQEGWDDLVEALASDVPQVAEGAAAPKRGKKKPGKDDGAAAVPKELAKRVRESFEDAKATPELALFGRMIANAPAWNVDAACQVAHAISTNRMSTTFDFFTAVDDLRPSDTQGADMMGTMQLGSNCYYRYAVLDLAKLAANLGDGEGKVEAAWRAASAFLRASIVAVPSGKQNSSAAHNPPSYVLAVLGGAAPVSLANAFVKPARPTGDDDLISASIAALEKYRDDVVRAYGTNDDTLAVACSDRALGESKTITRTQSFADLVEAIGKRVAAGASA